MSEVILGIDTSTCVCVGLARDGEIISSVAVGGSRSHAELLTPTIAQELARCSLTPQDLTAIAVGMGPGPFTGLRAGVASAEVMAHTLGIPLYRVCSLDILGITWASGLRPGESLIACTDARRKELYWAVYGPGGRRLEGPFVTPGSDLPDLACVGPGILLYPDAGAGIAGSMRAWLDEKADPEQSGTIDAGMLAAYAHTLEPAGVEPMYLRHADATASFSVKSVLPGVDHRVRSAGPVGLR